LQVAHIRFCGSGFEKIPGLIEVGIRIVGPQVLVDLQPGIHPRFDDLPGGKGPGGIGGNNL